MTDSTYLERTGVIFRAVINDLKRDPASAARDLEVPVEVVEDILGGRRAIPPEVLERAVRVWPVNERDFFPIHDDAPEGVRIMRAAESAATTRILRRGGRDYYEYRDTAMSRVSMFRPEWIRMIQPVEDDDPDNPGVEWNNGHFLNQFTYFVGSVNYYYEWNGVRHCMPMETGDSVSGLPYAPHSFAARNGEPALILALTYGGRLLGDAQHELSALGADLAAGYAFDASSPAASSAALLRVHLDNTSCSPEELARRTGIPVPRLAELTSGSAEASAAERAGIARALRVNERDLLPIVPDEVDGVRIVRGADAPSWHYPDDSAADYRIKELAGTLVCPNSRGLEIEVLGEGRTPLRSGLHTYLYNLGPSAVDFSWEHDGRSLSRNLGPDDSAYLKPFVPHRFAVTAPDAPGRLLVLRIGGKVSGDALLEASALGPASLRRLVTDSDQWYDPRGRNPARAFAGKGGD
ncbi:XRE family transcriptional regulator [Amycolatopsis anabasis]|uniref:XRE family transcriptional regulator n=1 Tax=Amycolatopsis anabasis TaxID=1840409 RepID=UPI00131E9133|nr:XRE family transcriptional regulator [Amycolatopsis anabasis]